MCFIQAHNSSTVYLVLEHFVKVGMILLFLVSEARIDLGKSTIDKEVVEKVSLSVALISV